MLAQWSDYFATTQARVQNATLKAAQQYAFDFALKHGLPTRQQEDWRYTPTQHLWQAAWQSDAELENKVPPFENGGPGGICLLNGTYQPDLSHLPDGVKVEIWENNATKHLASNEKLYVRSFLASMADALCTRGLLVTIQADVQLAEPLQLLHIIDNSAASVFLPVHIHIEFGENCFVEIYEKFSKSTVTPTWYHVTRSFVLQDGAQCVHKMDYSQEEGKSPLAPLLQRGGILGEIEVKRTSALWVTQKTQSRYEGVCIARAQAWQRDEYYFSLEGILASTKWRGLYETTGRGFNEVRHTFLHHASQTSSDIVYKGIAQDTSELVLNGHIEVKKGIEKVDAHLTNRNLLLSKAAKINTKPELKIYADDVKCSHGATVGQLDAEALFYMRSRGIDEPAARLLLVDAFAAEILDEL